MIFGKDTDPSLSRAEASGAMAEVIPCDRPTAVAAYIAYWPLRQSRAPLSCAPLANNFKGSGITAR